MSSPPIVLVKSRPNELTKLIKNLRLSAKFGLLLESILNMDSKASNTSGPCYSNFLNKKNANIADEIIAISNLNI